MKNNEHELYREYSDMMAVENGDYYNTEAFREHLAKSPVWERMDELEKYEEKLLKRALRDLRDKKEWQDLEADDIHTKKIRSMTHMPAFALLERYRDKIQHSYKSEAWFKARMEECDKVIESTSAWQTTSKKKSNILKHWCTEKVKFAIGYQQSINMSNRYEKLIYKWASICEQIKQADTAKEIEAEKRGIGNKYGFNPFMQSRESASGIFEDYEG